MLAYKQMAYSPSALENLRHLLFRFNKATNNLPGRCCVACPSRSDHNELTILRGRWSASIQYHYGTCMASQNEIHSFYVPSNGKLLHGCGTSRSPRQLASCTTMLLGGARVRTFDQWGGTSRAIKCNRTIMVIEFGGKRSIRGWSTPTIAIFTWQESNHLHQFLTCARWTETAREYALVE